MSKADKCQECECSDGFKGCALQYIATARKLLAEGDIAGAEH